MLATGQRSALIKLWCKIHVWIFELASCFYRLPRMFFLSHLQWTSIMVPPVTVDLSSTFSVPFFFFYLSPTSWMRNRLHHTQPLQFFFWLQTSIITTRQLYSQMTSQQDGPRGSEPRAAGLKVGVFEVFRLGWLRVCGRHSAWCFRVLTYIPLSPKRDKKINWV